MASSVENLALVAGQLQTKYLNEIYVVGHGDSGSLPYIVAWSLAVIGFVVPLAAIYAFGRRLEWGSSGDLRGHREALTRRACAQVCCGRSEPSK